MDSRLAGARRVHCKPLLVGHRNGQLQLLFDEECECRQRFSRLHAQDRAFRVQASLFCVLMVFGLYLE